MAKITMVGVGYVGLVTGPTFAHRGHQVTCHDIIPGKVEQVRRGEAPFFEKDLAPMIKQVVDSGKLTATLDASEALQGCEFAFICVPTPSQKDGSLDASYVIRASTQLAQVMDNVEKQVASGDVARFRPLAMGFDPLDQVLDGGLRSGELMVIGGAFGVGKTIFGLQVARNVARSKNKSAAIYICYEHDRTHLMSRLMCLESAEQGHGDDALTLRKLADLALTATNGEGLISRLQRMPRHAAVLDAMTSYSNRLALVKASGETSTLDQIYQWVREMLATEPASCLWWLTACKRSAPDRGRIAFILARRVPSAAACGSRLGGIHQARRQIA